MSSRSANGLTVQFICEWIFVVLRFCGVLQDGELDRKQVVGLLESLLGERLSTAQIDLLCEKLDPDFTDSIGFIDFKDYFLYQL